MAKILYFDCFGGISGDMTLAALLDLGVNQEEFIEHLNSLNVDGFTLDIKKLIKDGINATDVYVKLDEDKDPTKIPPKRNIHDINKIIDSSLISERAKVVSKEIFLFLGKIEAKVHGQPIENILFHEIGALDSIVDIIGTSICIDLLDVDYIYASPIHLSTGFVKCAAGIIPLPSPATSEILKGVPVYSTGIPTELVTPTGAAIIKTLADDFIPLPKIKIDSIGYGAGKKSISIKNLLRVYLGHTFN